MAEETKVQIAIEASQKTGAISAVASELEKVERKLTLTQIEANKMNESFDNSGKATDSLASSLAGMISVAAVGAFFKEAVEESLKEAEALRVLQGAVESTGASWSKYEDQIESFAKTQQAATRFDDTVTFEVLGKLALATDSVGEAMRATRLAQDLSVKSGKPLAETASIINQLLLGQERAVKLVTKEFGNYAGGATTAQSALDNLQRATMGAAAAEESAAKSFSQLKASIGDAMQIVGDIAVPELVEMAKAVGGLLRVTLEYIGAIDKKKGAQEGSVAALQLEVEKLRQAAEAQSIYGATTAEGIYLLDKAKQAHRDKNIELEKAIKLEKESSESGLRARQAESDAKAAADAADSLRKIEMDTFDQNMAADVAKNREARLVEKEYQEANSIDKFIAGERKKHAEIARLEDERRKNFASTLQFISTLSTAKNKELAVIGKAAAIGNATINTAEAITKALASSPPPFNFALASLVGAAGAAQIATISGVALERGGVVGGSQDGIQATIGEKGKKEAVLPLTDSRAMRDIGKAIGDQGGGGSGTVININVTAQVPEWRAIMQAIAEEAANGSPEVIRVARRLGDLNELHAGRAS